MKSRKSWWSIVGSIILESILFIEMAVELYTGEMTVSELILMLGVCFVLAVFIHFIIMKRKQ